MSAGQIYRSGTRSLLLAARSLEEALDDGDADEVPGLSHRLLNAALARESAGVEAGFRATDAEGAPDEPATLEDELAFALTELEVGEVLLAGSAATKPGAEAVLAESADRLETANALLTPAGRPARSGLIGTPPDDPKEFFTRLPATVNEIVGRTVGLGQAALTGLGAIPAASLQPVLAGVASLVPGVGALAQAGARAIRRALAALAKLVPESLREQIKDWAVEWWEKRIDGFADRITRRVLAVAKLDAAIKEAIAGLEGRTDVDQRLRAGVGQLRDLDERHAGLTKILDRIVAALSRLIGPLSALVPPAATWIYAAGGGGLVTAMGVAIWSGRDYLDTGVPFERVPGVRAVLNGTLPATP
jgi:hypothetical protein